MPTLEEPQIEVAPALSPVDSLVELAKSRLSPDFVISAKSQEEMMQNELREINLPATQSVEAAIVKIMRSLTDMLGDQSIIALNDSNHQLSLDFNANFARITTGGAEMLYADRNLYPPAGDGEAWTPLEKGLPGLDMDLNNQGPKTDLVRVVDGVGTNQKASFSLELANVLASHQLDALTSKIALSEKKIPHSRYSDQESAHAARASEIKNSLHNYRNEKIDVPATIAGIRSEILGQPDGGGNLPSKIIDTLKESIQHLKPVDSPQPTTQSEEPPSAW